MRISTVRVSTGEGVMASMMTRIGRGARAWDQGGQATQVPC